MERMILRALVRGLQEEGWVSPQQRRELVSQNRASEEKLADLRERVEEFRALMKATKRKGGRTVSIDEAEQILNMRGRPSTTRAKSNA